MKENFEKYFRAANYLSVTQIFLQDNFLLEEPLKPEHIKPRLLGHWGTCPGINFVYIFLNKLVKDHNANVMYVVGPGHGYPAVQSNLFIEGTLGEYYPNAKVNALGVAYISKQFSWPYGFPSHSSPHTPGVILEGGELGYSLSTSFGATLDNPDLIVACLVGDGEAETGPTATAWHINKFLNPKTDGAVLPILHLNGYKISGPTIFGRMSDEELQNLFEGYGYNPYFVDEEKGDVFDQMEKITEKCYSEITKIQTDARSGKEIVKPKWPMIVLRTPKGWTGPKVLHNKKIEGNHYSHQVVATNPRIDKEEFETLEKWLRSYKFEELFDKEAGFIKEITDLIPKGDKRIGKNKNAFGGPEVYKPLSLPNAKKFEEDVSRPGIIGSSSMRRAGEYLNEIFKLNKNNFRFFSPDETYSNKLDKIFETTKRSFVWPIKEWDEDLGEGRVIEMLSEHTLQGLIQGYVLTGRHGVFASYEAFIQIVASMADQYAKFLKQSKEIPWRGTIPSLNYILTSSGWRQEHNGFSHQNPGFIDNVLQRQGDFINVFFPADGSSTLAVLEKSLSSTNGINVIVAGKTMDPRWINFEEAKDQIEDGLGIWKFASDDNPDIVFAGVGDYLTREALAAVQLLREEIPEIKIRFVNVISLSSSGFGCGGNVLSRKDFHRFFTDDKPVIIDFHGYPQTIKQILFDYGDDPDRFKVNGYIENGSTTTPFDMHIRNETSRYHLLMDACRFLSENGTIKKELAETVIDKYNQKLKEHRIFIKKFGVDPEEIENWQWKRYMKTIIVNNGSASKKYALFDGEKEVLSSHYEKTPSSFILTETIGNSDTENNIDEKIFIESFSDFINKLIEKKLIVNRKEISAVAVRVVAPGLYFQEHHLVDNEYLYNLDNISDLSPLHVKPIQIEISNIKDELSDVRIFAISDSAYHKTMNQSAKLYAFPKKLIEKLGLYRYGYHGISVNSVVDEVKNNYGEFNNIIVCHLGGGSSITAVKNGQSFDTTMGFSPLEGLPMATRAGSADPNALISIMDAEDFDTKELQNFLYKECGLKGLSGISGDTRVILDEVAKGNQDAIKALDLYVYQVQKTIGAYSTVLGGFDALVFTGTIGERSAEVRKRICAGLQTLGVYLDPGKNKIQINGDGSIHADESKIKIFAIRTKEIKEMSKILQTLI